MTSAELKKKLQRREIPPVLFFHGEETQALEECFRLTVESLLEPPQRDFNLHYFTAKDNDIEGILNALQTLPVFSPRRLVVVRNVPELSPSNQTPLLDYLRQPFPEAVLLLTAGSVDKRLRLFQSLRDLALCVEFPRPKEFQLAELVKEKAAGRGVRFDREALALFCQRCGTESVPWQGELEKLCSFLGDKKAVAVEDVVAATLDGSSVSVFDVVNAVGRREPEALITLRRGLEEGLAPLFILTMLARHFRQLWSCETLKRQGAAASSIPKQAEFPAFFLERMLAQAAHFNSREYRAIFQWFLDTDRALKSSSGEGAALMELLVGRIVGEGKNKGPGTGPGRF
ncbi:MAG: DNA polymerase III subunit delta [Deltaproteobacteria bacterium]|nr:DNA polymerase III subunit delta [Deltaproteobacteria bacterium]